MNAVVQFCQKRLLRKDDIIVPIFYFGLNRTAEIIHCKLRLEISDLKGDLVRRHLADNPACQCGYQYENSKHYLFDCPLFNNARSVSIGKISNVNYTLDCLLYGNQNLSIVENSEIFQHVSNLNNKGRRLRGSNPRAKPPVEFRAAPWTARPSNC